ncbi:hypothetical protein OE810_05535 [Rhodobacteraceae bacterium XHP0102]|nr:hypothetical protein [Rhodobacteraceae bacterium XHP0102]
MDGVVHNVRRRAVFFVPGFDPAPPRALRERYRREAAKQAACSGHHIHLRAEGSHAWQVTAQIEGVAVETRIEVLAWSDIVRSKMRGGVLRSFAHLARAVWVYLRAGAIAPLFALRKGPVIAICYPVLVLLSELALAAALIALGAQWGVIGAAFGAALAYGFLRFAATKDPLYAHYLIDDYAYAAQEHGAYPPALEARLAEFSAKVAAACDADYDEVLLVGHSSGAYLAVSCLADLRRARGRAHGALALLTLGHVVPMVSFLPRATRLRADLALLAQDCGITWVDVTAPADGCAFALCDPVAVSGVAPANPCWPLVISAAFSQNLKPATWAALRWRLFETHFQYLNAFDGGGDYDYFAITAGPQTLGGRYGNRRASPSCITRAMSPHRGLS